MLYYPTDNTDKINKMFSTSLRNNIAQINGQTRSMINKINDAAAAVPSKYNDLKNRLTLSFQKTKRNDEEYIANTGSHTASGYAMSRRMNSNNAYNAGLNALDTAQANELGALEAKKRDVYADSDNKKREAINKNMQSKLDYTLKETDRLDNLYLKGGELELDWAKHKENKRLNDSTIAKNEAGIKKTENDILLENDENRRKNEEHELDMLYAPEEKQTAIDKTKAEIENINSDTTLNDAKTENTKSDTELIKAKTDTEKSNKKLVDSKISLTTAQTTKALSSGSGKSGGGGGKSGGKSSSGSSALSKMSPSELAKNITAQTSTKKIDAKGNAYYVPNPDKAYILLLEWKKKFNLSQQVVNDTAIYLGIQGSF